MKSKRQQTPEYRRTRLLRRYGLTQEDYETLAELQSHTCPICLEVKKLVIDHNHETGEVRGLLCRACNASLGHLEKRVWRRRAIAYLKARR